MNCQSTQNPVPVQRPCPSFALAEEGERRSGPVEGGFPPPDTIRDTHELSRGRQQEQWASGLSSDVVLSQAIATCRLSFALWHDGTRFPLLTGAKGFRDRPNTSRLPARLGSFRRLRERVGGDAPGFLVCNRAQIEKRRNDSRSISESIRTSDGVEKMTVLRGRSDALERKG